MHRDLRLETIFVLYRPGESVRVKLMSLGKTSKLNSVKSTSANKLTAFCAPESSFKDSLKTDEWAVGVILYYLFSGGKYPAFKGKKVKFQGLLWKKYAHKKDIKRLISGLLILDEEKRTSAAKALEKSSLFSTWLKEDILCRIADIHKQLKPRSDIKEVNLIWKGVLFFIVNRVLCAD